MGKYYEKVRDRLIRYARVNTQSAPYSGTWPTTDRQRDLGRMLTSELTEIGVSEVYFDEENCVVYGKIPASEGCTGESVGFIAHMDTAPDASGENVRPWVLKGYDGGDIVLNEEKNIVMRAADYPGLRQYIGEDLVLTDGTTLLGGDDKASIAAIMTMAEELCSNSSIRHGEISLAFTPDEEVGGLAHTLSLERFSAPVAYTLDGDHLGWYEDQTFNAAEAVFEATGLSVHTGTANGIMVNASDICAMFLNSIPAEERPQYTEGIEGFFHVISVSSTCEEGRIRVLIRDFDADNFIRRQELLKASARSLSEKFPGRVSLKIISQYRNMGEVIGKYPYLTERLRRAISDCGIEPVCEPFRGGTDGAALSFRGLPCPNLSAGYENAHGRFEFVPIGSMEKNVEILLRLAELFA